MERRMKLNSKDYGNIWFSADYHIGHANIIKYANRPYEAVEEMDEDIMEKFDNYVEKGDIVFFLGDIAFGEDYARRVLALMLHKAEVHFILGNHDKRYIKTIESLATSVNTLLDIEIDGHPITLCHYAMRLWNKSHFDAYQLFGHSHGLLQPHGKQYDVGVDNNKYMPVSYETVKDILKNRPHNENFIPEDKRR
jgi:calcineurin-like phosphoesterase family protein